ncbi:cytochrome P450 family protein [Goodfellowiella coeruleoviolacea]|uniref:Cytochrome P450 n=1 Tax=Goodfellowiella coeruleoviolacea TaxID=334858 RepID=A0AAE3GCR9_9PSEU|nr:cytochrome P450 [Goodfellowiella coeruleoviolacea]MCP2163783.1 Cytochrome P450 [Goodfellowiella coeruleoviolacea]
MTRHKELQEVLGSPTRFARNWRHWSALSSGAVPQDHPLVSLVRYDNMLQSDGADHTRLRGLISKAFTARRVQELRPRVEELVTDLLDRIEAKGGQADIVADLAMPLPLSVISELFGVAEADRPRVLAMARSVFSSVTSAEEASANLEAVAAYFTGLIAEKRQHPADDLTSALIQARDKEDRLSEQELFDTLWLMLVAGFETTEGVIANGVRALLTHPDQLELLRSGQCSWEAAVEEVLRWDTSIANLPFRYAIEDVELGGRTLRKGEAVLLSFASANRDPEQHGPDAHLFDITREQRKHLAFGHGVHFCLGSPLARLELQTALPALFDRFPDLALATPTTELTPVASVVSNYPTTLPVTHSATKAPAVA